MVQPGWTGPLRLRHIVAEGFFRPSGVACLGAVGHAFNLCTEEYWYAKHFYR